MNKRARGGQPRPKLGFLDWLGAFGTEDIGLDIGTSNVVAYVKKKKLVFSEASAVAVFEQTGKMFAAGTKAEEMEGKTPRGIRVIHPLRNSEIVDYSAAAYLLDEVGTQSALRQIFFHPRLILCCPMGVTGVQKRALLEAAVTMGVRKAVLLDQPVASLLGMGLRMDRGEGAMVADIGGGSAKISAVSPHGVVVSDTLYEAGIAMDQAIALRVREKYRVQIGRQAAESLKKRLGAEWDVSRRLTAAECVGKSLVTGLPVRVGVTGEDVAEALRPAISAICRRVLGVLQKTPPTLLADIRARGILLCGGCAQLEGLPDILASATGMPAVVVEKPAQVAAMGAGAALDYMNYLRDSLQELH